MLKPGNVFSCLSSVSITICLCSFFKRLDYERKCAAEVFIMGSWPMPQFDKNRYSGAFLYILQHCIAHAVHTHASMANVYINFLICAHKDSSCIICIKIHFLQTFGECKVVFRSKCFSEPSAFVKVIVS